MSKVRKMVCWGWRFKDIFFQTCNCWGVEGEKGEEMDIRTSREANRNSTIFLTQAQRTKKNNVVQANARVKISQKLGNWISKSIVSQNVNHKEALLYTSSTAPDDVKTKWNSLKDTYRKMKRIVTNEGRFGSGSEHNEKKVWMFYNHMGFMNKYIDMKKWEFSCISSLWLLYYAVFFRVSIFSRTTNLILMNNKEIMEVVTGSSPVESKAVKDVLNSSTCII